MYTPMNTAKAGSLALILTFLLVVASCAPPKTVTPVPDAAPLEATRLWQLAQRHEALKSYAAASNTYRRFLELYPEDERAGDVRYRLGVLALQQENWAEAAEYLQGVMRDFSGTRLEQQARLRLLEVALAQQAWAEVEQEATSLLQLPLAKEDAYQVYLLQGEGRLARNDIAAAIQSWLNAFTYISETPQRQVLLARLRDGLAKAPSLDRVSLLNTIAARADWASLLFELAEQELSWQHYEQAQELLEAFLNQYPTHESAAQAHVWLNELRAQARYRQDTIGCLLPLSGPLSAWGLRALQGIEMALMIREAQPVRSAFNPLAAEGPSPLTPAKPPLTILIKDTASSPEGARQGAEELAAEGVAALIGFLANVESVAEVAEKHQIPLLALTQQSSPAFKGNYVFRNFITPRLQVHTLIRYSVQQLGLQYFAILYSQDAYGQSYQRLFTEEVERQGGQIVFEEGYDQHVVDFSRLMKRLADQLQAKLPETVQPSVSGRQATDAAAASPALPRRLGLFIPDGPARATLIIPQLAFHDITGVQLLGTNLWNSAEFIKHVGPSLNGAIFTDGFFAASSNPQVRAFVGHYQEKLQEKPDFIAAIAFDSARLLFDIIASPEVHFRASIRHKLLHAAGHTGVTGHTRWTEAEDMDKELYLLKINNQEIQEVDFWPAFDPLVESQSAANAL